MPTITEQLLQLQGPALSKALTKMIAELRVPRIIAETFAAHRHFLTVHNDNHPEARFGEQTDREQFVAAIPAMSAELQTAYAQAEAADLAAIKKVRAEFAASVGRLVPPRALIVSADAFAVRAGGFMPTARPTDALLDDPKFPKYKGRYVLYDHQLIALSDLLAKKMTTRYQALLAAYERQQADWRHFFHHKTARPTQEEVLTAVVDKWNQTMREAPETVLASRTSVIVDIGALYAENNYRTQYAWLSARQKLPLTDTIDTTEDGKLLALDCGWYQHTASNPVANYDDRITDIANSGRVAAFSDRFGIPRGNRWAHVLTPANQDHFFKKAQAFQALATALELRDIQAALRAQGALLSAHLPEAFKRRHADDMLAVLVAMRDAVEEGRVDNWRDALNLAMTEGYQDKSLALMQQMVAMLHKIDADIIAQTSALIETMNQNTQQVIGEVHEATNSLNQTIADAAYVIAGTVAGSTQALIANQNAHTEQLVSQYRTLVSGQPTAQLAAQNQLLAGMKEELAATRKALPAREFMDMVTR